MAMKICPMPPVAILRYLFRYEPITGHLVWIRPVKGTQAEVGDIAGRRRQAGYLRVHIVGCGYFEVHRIAWVMTFGHLAEDIEVDHRDGNPANNAISNLRLATSSQQKRNKRVQSNNRCGLKGAYYHACHKGKKWRSQIKVGDQLIFLGYFHSAEEAHQAYADAASVHFGEFARAA